jgi:WD40 repeat protein
MLKSGDEPVPGYRVESCLGSGQFGSVWRALAPGGTEVALKFIPLGDTQGLKELRGVQRVKNIHHPQLMPILAIWLLDQQGDPLGEDALENLQRVAEQGGTGLQATVDVSQLRASQLVMAMLLGDMSLTDRLMQCKQEGLPGIPVDELLNYFDETAKGIDFLNGSRHDLGSGMLAVQHCDIKPSNILITGGGIQICDFGLAQVLEDNRVTRIWGSPAYMAPEHYQGDPPGPCPTTDQYSLAITYCELRTGVLPFHAEDQYSAETVKRAHCEGRLDFSKLTPAESAVMERATSRDPEARFPSTSEMARHLRRAVETGEAPPPAVVNRSDGKNILGRIVAGVVATALLAVIAVVAWPQLFPPSPPLIDCIVHVTPKDARLEIDGTAKTVDTDGRLRIKIRRDASIRIVARAHDHDNFEQTYTPDVLKNNRYRIDVFLKRKPPDPSKELPPLPIKELLTDAEKKLRADDFDGAVRIYTTIASRNPVKLPSTLPRDLRGPTATISALKISPDSKWLVTANDDSNVHVWDLSLPNNLDPTATWPHEEVVDNVIAVGPNSRWVVTGGFDTTARLWDLSRPGKVPAAELKGHSKDVTAIAVRSTSDGLLIATGSTDQDVRLWRCELVDGVPQCRLAPPLLPKLDAETSHPTPIMSVSFASDGRLITSSLDGVTIVWDLAKLPPTSTTFVGKNEIGLKLKTHVVGPKAAWIVTAHDDAANAGFVRWRHLKSQQVRMLLAAEELPGTKRFGVMARDDSGRRFAVAIQDGTTFVWDNLDQVPNNVANGSLSRRQMIDEPKTKSHSDYIQALQFDASGDWLATGSADKTAKLWRLGDASPQPVRLLHDSPVVALAFGPDGKWLVTGTEEGRVRLWDYRMIAAINRARRPLPPGRVPKGPIEARHPAAQKAFHAAAGQTWMINGRVGTAEFTRIDQLVESTFPTSNVSVHEYADARRWRIFESCRDKEECYTFAESERTKQGPLR